MHITTPNTNMVTGMIIVTGMIMVMATASQYGGPTYLPASLS